MKLAVTIPAYNEEKNLANVIQEIPREISGISKVEVIVISDGSSDRTVEVARETGADVVINRKYNLGLAKTFRQGIETALKRGADIIVNTDGDNHYNQSRIPELIAPIVRKKANIVIGGRVIKKLEGMIPVKKYGNMIGSWIVCKLAGVKYMDASTGFRAYDREAALKLNVLSDHTYTHETFFQAADDKLKIVEVPILARKVNRKSRLIKSVPKHIARSMVVILRTMVLFKPLRVFFTLGLIVFGIGAIFVIRFLYFYFTSRGEGHIQSLILAGALMMIGVLIGVMGLIASAIGWSRKMQEEVLYRIKKQEFSKKDVFLK